MDFEFLEIYKYSIYVYLQSLIIMILKIITFILLLSSFIYTQNWVRVEGTSLESYSVEVNPQNKNTIWFGHSNSQIYISYDGGFKAADTIQTPPFKDVNFPDRYFPVTSIFIHPSDTNLVFATTFSSSFKSTDYGKTWNTFLPIDTAGSDGEAVVCDPLHPDTIYIGILGEGKSFFRSYDRGNLWESFNMNDFSFCSIAALTDGSILGGSYEKGLLIRSTDKGTTWDSVYTTPPNAPFEIPKITYDPNNPGNVWATVLSIGGAMGYLIKSTDFGKTWTEVRSLGMEVNLWALEIDKFGRIIVGMFVGGEKGAYISTDNGISWNIYSSGILGEMDRAVVWMIKSNGDSLGIFVCDSDNGAYKLNNTITTVEENHTDLNSFNLFQNFPNPFNPSTKIRFSLPSEGFVQLNVYNTLGQKITSLLESEMQSGVHEVVFIANKNMPSGVYFYRLLYKDNTLTLPFILIK